MATTRVIEVVVGICMLWDHYETEMIRLARHLGYIRIHHMGGWRRESV
jgi:hypothetical protein